MSRKDRISADILNMQLTGMAMAGMLLAVIGPFLMYEIFRRLPRTEEPSSEEQIQQGLFNLAASIPINNAMRLTQQAQASEVSEKQPKTTVAEVSVR